MKLLEMYEEARAVASSLKENQQNVDAAFDQLPRPICTDTQSSLLALELDKQQQAEQAQFEAQVLNDARLAKQISDAEMMRIDELDNQINEDAMFARQVEAELQAEAEEAELQAVQRPAQPLPLAFDTDMTIELRKREGEARVGLRLQTIRRTIKIFSVAADSPAHDAQLEPGDTILAVNGSPITSAHKARDLISSGGDVVMIVIRRPAGTLPIMWQKPHLSMPLAVQLSLDKEKRVRVMECTDSAGAENRPEALFVGDALIAVNGVCVEGLKDACDKLAKASAPLVSLRVLRGLPSPTVTTVPRPAPKHAWGSSEAVDEGFDAIPVPALKPAAETISSAA